MLDALVHYGSRAFMALGVDYCLLLIWQADSAWRERRQSAALGDSVDVTHMATLTGDDLQKFLRGELKLEHELTVRIPQPLEPLERGRCYEEPLHAALEKAGVGRVAGGGTMMGEFSDIDVRLTDYNAGVTVLKYELLRLQAPRGTVFLDNSGETSLDA